MSTLFHPYCIAAHCFVYLTSVCNLALVSIFKAGLNLFDHIKENGLGRLHNWWHYAFKQEQWLVVTG